jgi:hypothetical protein
VKNSAQQVNSLGRALIFFYSGNFSQKENSMLNMVRRLIFYREILPVEENAYI